MKLVENNGVLLVNKSPKSTIRPLSSYFDTAPENISHNGLSLSKESRQVLQRLIQATDEVFNSRSKSNLLPYSNQSTNSLSNVAQQAPDASFRRLANISRSDIDKILGMAATKVARESCSNCLVSIEKKDGTANDDDYFDALISIFKQGNPDEKWGRYEYVTKIKKTSTASTLFVKEVLFDAIGRKLLSEGDGVVCFENGSISKSYKGMILLFDVDKTLFNISMSHISENFNLDVIEAVVKIAREIVNEGREGKKVGTTFVIGNRLDLDKHCKQMIINPFTGYPEDMRKVTDSNLNETMKNFAMLDGAFMIDADGTVLSAGTYIDVDTTDVQLPGFGTRHRCAAALTKKCNCLAVVVSETGGTIRVFKNGKVEMKI